MIYTHTQVRCLGPTSLSRRKKFQFDCKMRFIFYLAIHDRILMKHGLGYFVTCSCGTSCQCAFGWKGQKSQMHGVTLRGMHAFKIHETTRHGTHRATETFTRTRLRDKKRHPRVCLNKYIYIPFNNTFWSSSTLTSLPLPAGMSPTITHNHRWSTIRFSTRWRRNPFDCKFSSMTNESRLHTNAPLTQNSSILT